MKTKLVPFKGNTQTKQSIPQLDKKESKAIALCVLSLHLHKDYAQLQNVVNFDQSVDELHTGLKVEADSFS